VKQLRKLENGAEERHYEELFKTLSAKSQEIQQMQQELASSNMHIGRNAQYLEK
jgi:hypothetical protein